MNTLNDLNSAFFGQVGNDNLDFAVKAEDIQNEGGIDWGKHYFEPQPGFEYTLKLCINLEGYPPIVHRSVYKALPDPQRKGKTFRYISSGASKGEHACPALQAFFDLNSKKKEGDAVAAKKIDKFMGRSNEAASIVQIISSTNPKDEELIGKFRIMKYASFGENATICNMIDSKQNPSEAMIKNGEEKVNVFDPIQSPLLSLVCKKVKIGEGEGRGYSGSIWLDKKPQGCYVKLADGREHTFSYKDLIDEKNPAKGVKPELAEFFNKLLEELKNPDISIHNYFAFAAPGDERNTSETEDYIKLCREKLDEIIPVILEKSIPEIEAYGKADTSAAGKDTAKTLDGSSAAKILSTSAPSELQNSVVNQDKPAETTATEKTETKDESAGSGSSLVDDILNG